MIFLVWLQRVLNEMTWKYFVDVYWTKDTKIHKHYSYIIHVVYSYGDDEVSSGLGEMLRGMVTKTENLPMDIFYFMYQK